MQFYEYPHLKTEVNGVSIQDDSISADVTLRENAIADAIILANDEKGKTFISKVDESDILKISVKYDDWDNVWRLLFYGFVTELNPRFSRAGELVGIKGLGYGICQKRMRVAQEYGSQSRNETVDTLLEILTDANVGVIPKYIAKILATATDSGYSLNTTKIADVGTALKYIPSPYKPAMKVLENLIELVSAQNLPNAGIHWIVKTVDSTPYLCVATIGAHENPPADIWPTWWNTDQENSLIKVAKDMVVSQFSKLCPEANYVLYQGLFNRPANRDFWTEGQKSLWDTEGNVTLYDEASIVKVGSKSLRASINAYPGGFLLPAAYDWGIDITKIGTAKTVPHLNFYFYHQGLGSNPASKLRVELGTGDPTNNDEFYHEWAYTEIQPAAEWMHIRVPIGPFLDLEEEKEFEWKSTGSPNWNSIDYIEFWFAYVQYPNVYIDGLYLEGLLTRAAYDLTKASAGCIMKLIRDDIGKDDTLVASDDSGMIGQFAKAELYRAVTTPIVGTFKVPLQPTMLPGQLAYIQASRTATGYHIDKTMRILQVIQHFGLDEVMSYITVTDDITNSKAREPHNQFNMLMSAISPDFQDALRSTLVGKDIDIEQAILGKDYST